MRRVRESPIGQALLFGTFYGVLSASIMLLNNSVTTGIEAPWTWQWALWASTFAPAVITALFAAASTSPEWSRLKWLYVTSLLIILALMEISWIADAGFGTSLTVVAVACLVVATLFQVSEKRSGE